MISLSTESQVTSAALAVWRWSQSRTSSRIGEPVRVLNPLASSIRRSVLNYAKEKYGALCKKLSTQGPMGSTGWPDDMILGWREPDRNTALQQGGSVIFLIEFKRLGGKLTKLQQ